MAADARRRQVHVLADRCFDLIFGHTLAGAVQVDIDRQRLGNTDGVGELDRATVGKAGRDGSFSWERTDLVKALKESVKA